MVKIQTRPRFHACRRYQQVWRKSDQNWRPFIAWGNILPIISLWNPLITIETRVWNQSAPKPYIINPLPPTLPQIKFHEHWPAGLGDVFTWKCRRTTTDGLRTTAIQWLHVSVRLWLAKNETMQNQLWSPLVCSQRKWYRSIRQTTDGNWSLYNAYRENFVLRWALFW